MYSSTLKSSIARKQHAQIRHRRKTGRANLRNYLEKKKFQENLHSLNANEKKNVLNNSECCKYGWWFYQTRNCMHFWDGWESEASINIQPQRWNFNEHLLIMIRSVAWKKLFELKWKKNMNYNNRTTYHTQCAQIRQLSFGNRKHTKCVIKTAWVCEWRFSGCRTRSFHFFFSLY